MNQPKKGLNIHRNLALKMHPQTSKVKRKDNQLSSFDVFNKQASVDDSKNS